MFLIPLLVTAGVYFAITVQNAASNTTEGPFAAFRWIHNQLPILLEKHDMKSLKEHIPQPIRIAVFDANNQIVFSTIKQFSTGTSPGLNAVFGYSQKNSRHIHVQWDSVRTTDGRQFVIMAEFPREPRPDFRRRQALPGIITLSCLFIFAVFTSAAIIRYLTGSVRRLEQATRRISDGDLDFELTARGNSEIASLTRSFDRMRRTLKEEYARRARFIMGISHDLRTPLSLIEGYAEAISDGLASDPEEHRRYISVIRDKAHLLEGMVNQLIDFARLETEEWKRSLSAINITKFLNDLGKQYEQDAQLLRRNFSFGVDLPDSLEIAMDPTLTLRAFENLIGNAIRYTKPEGSIHLFAHAGSESIYVSISDTGVGIPEIDLPYIFDPFYRGSNSRREEGTGLGLAVVKSVIESQGWSIDVRSNVQHGGTTFIISIPRSADAVDKTVSRQAE